MQGKTLMYGMGATKAGTTWLYRFLSDHPECAMPHMKELHFFDRLGPKLLPDELNRLEAERIKLLADVFTQTGERAVKLHARIDEIEAWMDVMRQGLIDPNAYIAFLSSIADQQTKLVGDITPAYGLLDEQALRLMMSMSDSARFVLLLRDPVDRLWSNLRMMASRQLKEGADLTTKSLQLFDRFLRGEEEGVARRSDYFGMLERMNTVIPAKKLYTAYFEEMFQQSSIDRLCEFLGINSRTADFETKVHASGSAKLDEDRTRAAREALAPQYDYVEKVLGNLPARWTANRKIVA